MTRALFVVAGCVVVGAAVSRAQAPPQPANLQATQDPRYADIVAACKTPPPGRAGGAGAAPGGAAAAAPGRGTVAAAPGRGAGPAAAPAGPAEYAVAAIPGVIEAGQTWTLVYQTTGNNADGILATDDGGLLLAQNDNGLVIKLDRNNQVTTAFRETNTGGALSRSARGALFVASRGIGTAVLQLEPQRRVFANRYQGDPLECIGGVLNDVSADSKGGVYFTMGGLFYADAKGQVAAYGQDLRTNGVVLSPDEKTLYVTNGAAVAAFDVRADGALANQREFAKLPAGGGDGLTVDAAGRLYVTVGGGAGGARGVQVFAADGRHLGLIDGPRPFITAAFAGPDKRTLYAVANNRQIVEVYRIPMVAQGFTGRAK